MPRVSVQKNTWKKIKRVLTAFKSEAGEIGPVGDGGRLDMRGSGRGKIVFVSVSLLIKRSFRRRLKAQTPELNTNVGN